MLERYGWIVPDKDLTFCTTGPDENSYNVKCRGLDIKRTARADGFKALGCQVTFNNRFEKELDNRIATAWAAFYKHGDILRCKAVPFGKRYRLLQNLVMATLFWCAGSWSLTEKSLCKLRGVQQRMVRKILQPTRFKMETQDDFCKRTGSMIKHFMLRRGAVPFDEVYHREVYKWAGWVVRIEGERLTKEVLMFKNWDWLKNMSAQFGGRQQHGRILRTWRWERPLYKFFDTCTEDTRWQEVAKDKASWVAQLDKMVRWRTNNR